MKARPESVAQHYSCDPMPVNRDKPDRWKPNIVRSAGMYKDWLMRFASEICQGMRVQIMQDVGKTFRP